ncbi:MAG TPA: CHAD domain-containing protein [Gemmataceae bacterium]|nr:CHAD domain-containing protein [Gemmataceae bacterium]
MNKWVPDVGPSDRTTDVAARALRSRLEAVRHYLRRAVEDPDQPENVHQLRVWTRRADAALALYADLLPSRPMKWLRKWVRRLRRAAGAARDCDVFARRAVGLNGLWHKELRGERRKAQAKIETLYRRLDHGRRLKRRGRKLLAWLDDRDTGPADRFADLARARLHPAVAAFFDADPTDPGDAGALHQFRIRGKELRYAMELLAAAFPARFREELYPVVGTLQDKLGNVNDLTVAQRRLQERIDRAGTPAELSELRRQSVAVAEDLVRARSDFRRWWTPESRDGLRQQFAEMFDGPAKR